MDINRKVEDAIKNTRKEQRHGTDRNRGNVLINEVPSLSEHFNLKTIRKQGAILSVAQLHSDTNEYLNVIHSKPGVEVYLRRINVGIEALMRSWKYDQMKNTDARAELDDGAIQRLSERWHDNKMPEHTSKIIEVKLQEQLEIHYDFWVENTVINIDGQNVSEQIDAAIESELWQSLASAFPQSKALYTECLIEDLTSNPKNIPEVFRGQLISTLVDKIYVEMDNNLNLPGHSALSDEIANALLGLAKNHKNMVGVHNEGISFP